MHACVSLSTPHGREHVRTRRLRAHAGPQITQHVSRTLLAFAVHLCAILESRGVRTSTPQPTPGSSQPPQFLLALLQCIIATRPHLLLRAAWPECLGASVVTDADASVRKFLDTSLMARNSALVSEAQTICPGRPLSTSLPAP